MITIKQVNRALKDAGFNNVELVKGKDYYYFSGEDTDYFTETGVYGVFQLNALSVQDWVDIFTDKYNQAHN